MHLDGTQDLHCGNSAPHDSETFYLSLFLCAGVVVSYLPQHWRIISNKTGEGISPGYLLLGATSSACALLNIVTLQYGVLRCCSVWSGFACFENLLGIIQIFLQWLMFNIILVLFLYYYPHHLKYVFVTPMRRSQSPGGTQHKRPRRRPTLSSKVISFFYPSMGDQIYVQDTPASSGLRGHARNTSSSSTVSTVSDGDYDDHDFDPNQVLLPSMTHDSKLALAPDFRHAIGVSILVGLHLLVSVFITVLLLLVSPKYGEHEPDPHFPHNHSTKLMLSWATVLGLLATVLAAIQYVPQLWHTWSTRLVGSLSIPTMMIQTPGSFVFVYSYVANGGRPGTNWTTWIVFLVTGSLQGVLLVMCCCWKLRQKAAGIDDYGNDIRPSPVNSSTANGERQRLIPSQPPVQRRRSSTSAA